MRASAFFNQLQQQIDEVKAEGLYKSERVITSQQQAQIEVASGDKVINFCANNYLGLANSPELIKAAQQGLDDHGFGVASVRFICGTQDIHKTLEQKISEFLETEDTILYSSCFDANAGLFETILGPDDAIISDALNHASIIDGVRLCKAKRFRYANNDMSDLEKQLIAADEAGAKTKLIATDGVDIITGTLGKALGGASGGYTSGKKEIVEWLRQRSRPYLFSNSLAPSIVTASIKVLEMLSNGGELRAKLWDNAKYFREQMEAAGFTCAGKDHAIIPVMLGDAKVASAMADKLLAEGIYVTGFSFPVVPKGQARIRTQISAAHTKEQLDTAIAAFTRIGKEMGVI